MAALEITIQTVYHWDGHSLEFIPESNLPGFTHRVRIDGINTRSWLHRDYPPSRKNAEFFFRKHILKEK